ncbi:MAG TPA: DUF3500 domain-containing protein [Planctomycetaceae bacterium]|nr:DUF3500 domain-containing protein [Planctomycetaceae bacterium]
MHTRRLLLSTLVIAAIGVLLWAGAGDEPPPSGAKMAEAARAYLDKLSDSQRDTTTFGYDDPERLNWHFIPRERKGLPLKELEGEPLQAARRLIASGLSQSGFEQALNVMSLEEVLYLLEGGDRQTRRLRRDPQNYYLSVFGEPGQSGTWGWRLEGHHLSLNYSINDGKVVASTPEFFGANPARVDAGPERAIRVLAPEEDLARQLFKLCTPDQQERAWIDRQAPDDLRGGGEPQPPATDPVGLPVSKMSDDQKKLLQALLSEYLRNMPPDVEQDRRGRINSAGLDKIFFAWWGSSEPNERHAYRVQGPTFLIEYNNTQNNANHLHTNWRDPAGDFNVPVKK